jgi:hypothetical protein
MVAITGLTIVFEHVAFMEQRDVSIQAEQNDDAAAIAVCGPDVQNSRSAGLSFD